jgi:methionine sulfoxide reductase catalytic subunit
MLIKLTPEIPSSEITDERLYLRRREFMRLAGGAALSMAAGATLMAREAGGAGGPLAAQQPLVNVKPNVITTDEKANTFDEITSYNNFYEFGTDKGDPKEYSGKFRTKPWSIAVEGEVAKPASYNLEDFIKPYALEERVYRLRCVEAWSMVIPWIGIPLKDVISRVQPTGKAKFVEFTTLADRQQMWYVARGQFPFPYVEGLRLDEAMHPLAILAVGLYGEVLPNQNGAPIRLVVPWKYGFKSIKSIVKMRFTEKEPLNTWQRLQGSEYGFYANVNPQVDHPRWTQAREVRLPGLLKNHKTEMFNGYADQVASLYTGMDLRKNY